MKTIATILFLSIIICGCTALPQISNIKDEQSVQNILSNTIVPNDPIESMRIECDRDETVAYKLAMFKQYLKKECNINLPIYLSPDAANKVCEAKPVIITSRVDNVALGDCISYFCRTYDLNYLIKDNIIIIDLK